MLNVLYEEKPIRGIMLNACLKRVAVEVRLDRQEASYGTHLLYAPFAGVLLPEDRHLLIAPLEPAMGNVKIRGSQVVELSFHMGFLLFNARCEFVRPMTIDDQQVMQITMPRVIRFLRRRSNTRLAVKTSSHGYRVEVRSKGRDIAGDLLDCSHTGLALSCKPLATPLQENDRVVLAISHEQQKENVVILQGLVRHRTLFRNIENLQDAHEIYGIQLMAMDLKQEYYLQDILGRIADSQNAQG